MCRALLALVGALASVQLGLVVPADGADSTIWVPRDAWVTITGHGYGHGHGMSQYGAKGAAEQGLTARRITGFYYPGTALGTATGDVSVLITADTDDDTVVLPRSGLAVRDLAAGDVWTLPANGAKRWRLSSSSTGRSVVAYLTDRWHWWKGLRGDGQFTAQGDPITLVTPSGQTKYRGVLQSRRPSDGSRRRHTVNVLKLDGYLKGVVPREMPASWPRFAVQAQAIAARTYAAYERAHPLSRTYQICDTTSCQVYGGYSAEHPDSNAAVDATAGQVRTYDGRPAFTQFSSSSGGWTSAGSMPYLPAKKDPYDGATSNPMHSWSVRLDARRIESTWPAIGNLTGITVTKRDGNGDWGGRVLSITLRGGQASRTMSGDDFRYRLGLRSTWVSFKVAAK
jgi:stage II sporulation protein D